MASADVQNVGFMTVRSVHTDDDDTVELTNFKNLPH